MVSLVHLQLILPGVGILKVTLSPFVCQQTENTAGLKRLFGLHDSFPPFFLICLPFTSELAVTSELTVSEISGALNSKKKKKKKSFVSETLASFALCLLHLLIYTHSAEETPGSPATCSMKMVISL